jgi:hypothetical protein
MTSETSAIAATIATARLRRPPIASRLDSSTMYSFWPIRNRIRCTDVGAIRKTEAAAVPTSAAK